jgi:hypothetical protein
MAKRWLVWCAGGLAVISASAGSLGAGGSSRQLVPSHSSSTSSPRATLTQYCVTCHDDRLEMARLTLT